MEHVNVTLDKRHGEITEMSAPSSNAPRRGEERQSSSSTTIVKRVHNNSLSSIPSGSGQIENTFVNTFNALDINVDITRCGR